METKGKKGRLTKSTAKGLLHGVLFSQRFGVNVLPLHFYSSIPNMREITLPSGTIGGGRVTIRVYRRAAFLLNCRYSRGVLIRLFRRQRVICTRKRWAKMALTAMG